MSRRIPTPMKITKHAPLNYTYTSACTKIITDRGSESASNNYSGWGKIVYNMDSTCSLICYPSQSLGCPRPLFLTALEWTDVLKAYQCSAQALNVVLTPWNLGNFSGTSVRQVSLLRQSTKLAFT